MLVAVPQRPPNFGAVRLGPPAVQFRQIDPSIDEDLHAARSTRLPGSLRRVDPDVHPLHQMLRQQHIVVAQEDDVRPGLWLAYEVYPFMDQDLPRPVLRMSLAGNDQLHRSFAICQKAQQTRRIVQQQVRSLVRGEPPRKTECQCIGIEHMFRLLNCPGRSA